jgi:hypothetical protein
MSCHGEGQLAAGVAQHAPLYVQDWINFIHDDELDIPEENEEDETIGSCVAEERGDFSGPGLHIPKFLQIPADRDETVQQMIKQHFFRLAGFASVH